jgi:hypothetical protein
MIEIKTMSGIVTFEDTPEARDRVWNIALDWFKTLERWSGESICQSDDGWAESPHLAGKLADKGFKFKQIFCDEN